MLSKQVTGLRIHLQHITPQITLSALAVHQNHLDNTHRKRLRT
ncbi:hypothetical protein [Comamonas terrigena]|nr:hypothetical protein [Comamonas terrigena]